MGFFDSKSTVETSSSFDNPELRQYTQTYRNSSPWTFATLDPTATLAAMTKAPKGTLAKKFGGVDSKFGKELQKQAQSEEMEREMSNDALKRIQARQESGEFLTPKETEFINTSLDKAFEYAHKTGIEDWTKATQMMAGSRGLRMSDTPAAEPALKELRNFELGLGSQRAQMGLNATLDFSKNQQTFDANFSSMLKNIGQNRWQTRLGFMFGGGLQGASQLSGSSKGTNTTSGSMSGFGKVMGGLQMAQGVLDLGKSVGGMMMGGASLPGGGGGPMSMLGGGGSTGYGAGVNY